jgi:hypothetical protein
MGPAVAKHRRAMLIVQAQGHVPAQAGNDVVLQQASHQIEPNTETRHIKSCQIRQHMPHARASKAQCRNTHLLQPHAPTPPHPTHPHITDTSAHIHALTAVLHRHQANPKHTPPMQPLTA